MSELDQALAELKRQKAGTMAGIIACVLAVCGILTVGFLFIPLAAITALCGLLIAIENKNSNGVWVNVLAWVLVLAGVFTSPLLYLFLLGIFGI